MKSWHISRMFTPVSLNCVKEREVRVFSDASEKAISAVVYVRTTSDSADVHVGFVIGKSKIAPLQMTDTFCMSAIVFLNMLIFNTLGSLI